MTSTAHGCQRPMCRADTCFTGLLTTPGALASMAETHIALFRGINVGGKSKLPMRDLVEIFSHAGAKEVRTYIQSGNVVFSAGPQGVSALADVVSDEIQALLGLRVPVILRTQAALEAARDANPYQRYAHNRRALHVVFLADEPPASAAASLDPHRSSPDKFTVLGREVFLHCPNGIARSNLTTAWFDRALGSVSTIRNWNTVNALVDLCRGGS